MARTHPTIVRSQRTRHSARRTAARRSATRRATQLACITEALYNHFESMIDPDEDDITQIRSYFEQTASVLMSMLRPSQHGTVYIFGDKDHGANVFDMFEVILPCLSPAQKVLLENSRYFTETETLYRSFKTKFPDSTRFYPCDELLDLNPPSDATHDQRNEMESKRLHTLNRAWIPYISDHLTEDGLNIIALGRSHIYAARSLPENAAWPSTPGKRRPVRPFQQLMEVALSEEAHVHPVKTFVMVSYATPNVVASDEDADLKKPLEPAGMPKIYF